MEKKIRNIYEVEFSEIVSWDEENDIPGDTNIIESVGEEKFSLLTANITEAYRFYRKNKDFVLDNNGYCRLLSREIDIDDKEWFELVNKDKIDYDVYSKYEAKPIYRDIAYSFSYNGKQECDDRALEELLIVQSENFNMRVICERAGISYSTYRGFKNNKKSFSSEKKCALLRVMNEIGNECWDEDLEDKYKNIKLINDKYYMGKLKRKIF